MNQCSLAVLKLFGQNIKTRPLVQYFYNVDANYISPVVVTTSKSAWVHEYDSEESKILDKHRYSRITSRYKIPFFSHQPEKACEIQDKNDGLFLCSTCNCKQKWYSWERGWKYKQFIVIYRINRKAHVFYIWSWIPLVISVTIVYISFYHWP